MYKKYIKRLLDLFFSILLLVILSPVFLVVSILVKLKMGSPIIFKQKRPGKDEKIFTLYKFRTMTDKKDENGNLLSDSERLTKFGKILRSTSLDELPQLVNILRGDMSFVGPRPLLVEYLERYSEHQKRRHEVKPGITGLAQINGRNLLSWDDTLNFDVEYVDSVSIGLDFKIILKSIETVLNKKGVYTDKNDTREIFKGTNVKEKNKMNEEINILLLSAGRRVELIECFRNASKKLGINTKIITADISNMAPAIYFSDKNYIIPKISEENYIESIIKICNDENIKVIVPTIDTELLKLSQNKFLIEENTDAKVLVSDEKIIKICRDKRNTQKFFEENSFGVPKIIEDINQVEKYPLFIKPMDGSSSINTFKINNRDELVFFWKYIKNPMVQEFIEGDEYTVDAFLDFESNIISIVPRRRIAVRSGEIIKGKIEKDKELISDVKRLLNALKPIGQITIQCMKTKEGIKYIEINPRFGGGAPMSIKAGADSCENIYRLLMNEKLTYNENYKDKLVFLRFDDSIILDENMMRIEND